MGELEASNLFGAWKHGRTVPHFFARLVEGDAKATWNQVADSPISLLYTPFKSHF